VSNVDFIKFDIKLPTTFVISNMGSGKSTELKAILQSKEYIEKTVLCISFRKTFTYEFASKYNLIKYMDI
jgi:hypothetical protein